MWQRTGRMIVLLVVLSAGSCQVHPGGSVATTNPSSNDRLDRRWTITTDSGVTATIAESDGSVFALELPNPAGPPVTVAGPAGVRIPASATDAIMTPRDGRIPAGYEGEPVEVNGQVWEVQPAGTDGFWRGSELVTNQGRGVRLRRVFPAGDQGLPGTVSAEIDFVLTSGDELVVTSRAAVSEPTLVHVHPAICWNLAGDQSETLAGQTVTLGAVAPDEVIEEGSQTSVVEGIPTGRERHAMTLRDVVSGRALEVWTTSPSIQRTLDPSGQPGGVGLTIQPLPTGSNRSSTWQVRPGESREDITIYRFIIPSTPSGDEGHAAS